MKNIRFFLITLLSFAAISLFGQNPPTWNPVPTDQSVECDGTDDPGGAFAAWLASNGNGTATSDVGCENLSYSNDYNVANWISDCGNTRHVTVVFTATDDCGSTNASATFSIVDTEAPVADQAADALDATVACDDAAALTAALALEPTFTDNCDASVAPVLQSNVSTQTSDGSCTDYSYTITRTWTATDACSNESAVYTQVITVQDILAPVADQAADALDATVACDDAATLTAALALEPTFTDNCDASVAPVLQSNVSTQTSDGSCTDYSYTITRTWTATDACTNESDVYTQVITVQDILAPVADQAAEALDATVACDDATALSDALTLTPTFTDNCDASVTPVLQSNVSTQTSDGSCTDYSYTITRTWTATDACTNESDVYTQVITVQDILAPVADQAADALDATVACDDAAALTAALALEPTFTDNCDASVAPVLQSNVSTQTSDGSCTDYSYTITRTWTATDACTNESDVYTQVITVQDILAPVADQAADALDATVACDDAAALTAALALEPTFTDNCDASVAPVLQSNVSTQTSDGSCTDYSYTITRTWTATDACTNESDVYTQVITVQDILAPVADQAADALDATVACDDAAALTAALALEPTFTDNCDASVAPVLQSNVSTQTSDGSCTDYSYTITRTWTATDACTNESDVYTQVITVQDISSPLITGSLTLLTVEGCDITDAPSAVNTVATLEALDGNPAIADNCSDDADLTVSSGDVVTGSCPLVITRTYTVTDPCGNSATIVHIINVDDSQPPAVTGTIDTTKINNCDPAYAPVAETTVAGLESLAGDLLIEDGCTGDPALSISYTDASEGTCPDTITRTYTITDACSNSAQVVHVIVLNDTDGPYVANPLGDIRLNTGFDPYELDISDVFDDPNTPVLDISVQSSEETVVTATLDGDMLTITEVSVGTAIITLTASDGVSTAEETFNFTVNGAPVVMSPIPDQVADAPFGTFNIDTAGVFADPNNDLLSITLLSSDISVLTAALSGTNIVLTEVGPGTATITVTADDGLLNVSDAFEFKVNAAPVVTLPIPDQLQNEGFVSASINTTGVFTDPNDDPLSITEVASSDGTVVTVAFTAPNIEITEVAAGTAFITVTAGDGRLSVTDTFEFKVNGAPFIALPIPDQVQNEGFTTASIDTAGVFDDPNGDDLTITGVTSNNEAVVTVAFSAPNIVITEEGVGTATISVSASDGSLSASDDFEFKVNGAPVVQNAIPDQNLFEHFSSTDIDITSVFSDPNSDALILSATSLDEDVITVSIEGTTLTLTEVGLGSTTITVTASDGALSVDDLFDVTVTNVNDPPEVAIPITDRTYNEYFGSALIELGVVFSDPDAGTILNYSATSSATDVVTVGISGSTLTITEQGLGTSTIIVTADDGEYSARDTFLVNVNNVNDAPVAVNPVPDLELYSGFATLDIDLDTIFSDPDGDPLTYEAVSGNTGVAGVSVTANILTITENSQGSATITVTASDGFLDATDEFAVNVTDSLPPGWSYDIHDYNYSGQVTARVFLESVPVASGYLAAFVGTECRGIIEATYFPPQDYYVFVLIAYSNNAVGDILNFKYYDPVSKTTYDLHETLEFEPDMIVANANSPFELNYCLTCRRTFTTGWNWFSVNVLMEDMSIGALLPGCVTDGDYIKDQVTSAYYYEGYGWYGGLGVLDPADLYKAKLTNVCGIDICGNSIDVENTPIELVSGWNWIGYLPLEPLPIASALGSLSLSDEDYIKNQTASSMYYAGFGWYGELEELTPTDGYMIKITNPNTLIYPAVDVIPSGKKSAGAVESPVAGIDFNPNQYEFNGTVTAKVYVNGLLSGSEQDLVLAYVGDECRGISGGLYFDPANAFAYPLMIHSNIEQGEIVTFRYYDARSGQIYQCGESLTFSSDMIIADAFKSFDLNVNTAVGGIETGITAGTLLSAHPNPFDGRLNIEYTISKPTHVRLAVFDIFGKLLEIVEEADLEPGAYTTVWNASGYPEATYIISLTVDDTRFMERVILID